MAFKSFDFRSEDDTMFSLFGMQRYEQTIPGRTSSSEMSPCVDICTVAVLRSLKPSRLKYALWCAVTLLIAVLSGKWGTKSTFYNMSLYSSQHCLHKYLLMNFLLLVVSLFIHCWNVPAGYKAHLLVHVVTWRGSIFLIWCGINFSTGSAAFSTAVLWDIHQQHSGSAGDLVMSHLSMSDRMLGGGGGGGASASWWLGWSESETSWLEEQCFMWW